VGNMSGVIEAIHSRRSVREFSDKKVEDDKVLSVLDAGRWAPSAANNQPWRFIVVSKKETLNSMAELTVDSRILENAAVAIAIFLDKNVRVGGDYRTKNVLSMGACVENMLIAAHSLGLGAVWLGEILKNKEEINDILEASSSFEPVAVVAIGYPIQKERTSQRSELKEIAYSEKYNVPI